MYRKKVQFRRTLPLLLTLLFIMVVGLFTNYEASVISAQEDLTLIYPEPESGYLANPGMGWQQSSTDDDQLLPETVSYIQRSQISWRVLNPADGVFNWQILDNFINQAAAQGKQASFRVYTMRGERFGGHQLPQYVLDNGARLTKGKDKGPDYANCVYQQEWGEFVNELRLRYDGNPDIAFIDISGYGNFNEWSWTNKQTEWEDDPFNPVSLDAHARDRLAAIFTGGSDDAHECSGEGGPTVAYDYPGFQHTQLVMPYAGLRQSTDLVAARTENVGIRYDCLGRRGSGTDAEDGVMARIGASIDDTWRTAPIIFEFCGRVAVTDSEMAEADILLRASHGTMVNDTLYEPRLADPVRELMLNVGYRYQLQEVRYASATASGLNFNVNMVWRNVGYAPAYARMGQEFTLHLYLIDEQGNVVMDEEIPSADVNSWMPADTLPGLAPANVVDGTVVIPDIPDGDYDVRVGIMEERTGNLINIAIQGRDDDGRYQLGTVTIDGNVTATPEPSDTPEPSETPEPEIVIHVGNIDGAAFSQGSEWTANVQITVHTQDELPMTGVSVIGEWDNGSEVALCVTGDDGTCTLTSPPNRKRNKRITFTLTNLSHSMATYDSSANHDPDGDSDGTTITVRR